MRRFACVCCAVVLVLGACSEPSNQPAAGADSAQMAPPPAGVNLADLAGTWNFNTRAETGDSVLVTYQVVMTPTTDGWQLLLPNRPPVPMQVLAVAGDSVVTHAGPFESVLRAGVQVTTHTVLHFQGNSSAAGTIVARYTVTTADSVVNLRTDGTKSM
jgi:hypothetical protein